ncbi:MAG: amidohydrolase family protein [Nitrospirota bacterium]
MTCELILKADYIVPIITPAIRNGIIYIKDGVIIQCDEISKISCRDKSVVELKNVCLLPGFVNAHTHLELTNLKDKIPYKDSFIQWIRDIVEVKKTWNKKDYIDSLKLSIKQLIASGTTTVADITTTGLSPQVLSDSNLRCRIYKEITGFKSELISQIMAGLNEYLSKSHPTNLIDFGLAPHAPYSVNPQLFIKIDKLAKTYNLPMSIHIAEAKEELELLMKGEGECVSLLKELGVWEDNWIQRIRWIPPKLTPVKYLDSLGILNSNLIGVHLNYITNEEIEILKEKRVGVVHCPKSHKFFQREDFPIQKLIDKGILVALGTDSLASNDSLSMLEEMKEIKRRYNLSGEGILKLATINGAKALDLDDRIGSLQPGKKADIIGIKLPDGFNKSVGFNESVGFNDNLYDFIVKEAKDVVFTMVDGKILNF